MPADMQPIIQKIRDFADQAHGDQQRKYAAERYIEHPLRVMRLCEHYDSSLPTLAAALLHDVLEDTPVTLQHLRQFLQGLMPLAEAESTLRLVVALTNVYEKISYPRLNRKQRKTLELQRLQQIPATAQTIKYADVIDNCRGMAMAAPDFAPVFLKECSVLLSALTRGNTTLREQAIAVVRQEQQLLGYTANRR